jgi:hypothetical protein
MVRHRRAEIFALPALRRKHTPIDDEDDYDWVAAMPPAYRPAAVKNVLNSRASRSGSSSGT